MSVLNTLKNNPILAGIDDKSLSILALQSKEKTFEKGEVLCRKDRYAQSVIIIQSGTVSEYAMDWNGFNIIVKTGGKQDCFGELGVLLGEGYFTTVIAETQVRACVIPEKVFSEIIWSNQSAIKEILATLLSRLQKSAQKSISYTMFNSEGRLAYMLSIMHREKKHAKYIETTQEELSVRCGIARQTVSTTLNKWKKAGLIEISRGKIAVLEIEPLTELAINCAKHF